MRHRLINSVLAILMLMPAGICTCDGGVVFRSGDPVQSRTQSQDYDVAEQANGRSDATGADPDSQSDRCPAPCPHQPCCRVLAPEFLAGSSASDISTALHVIVDAVVVEWPTPKPSRSDSRPFAIRLHAPPIYLANCALLI